jgi:hypothetical protein
MLKIVLEMNSPKNRSIVVKISSCEEKNQEFLKIEVLYIKIRDSILFQKYPNVPSGSNISQHGTSNNVSFN